MNDEKHTIDHLREELGNLRRAFSGMENVALRELCKAYHRLVTCGYTESTAELIISLNAIVGERGVTREDMKKTVSDK